MDTFYKEEDELAKKAKSAKWEMESAAIKEQMNLEKHQRKHIKHAKEDQLNSAKDDLF